MDSISLSIIFLFVIVCLILLGYFSIKIVNWYEERRKFKFNSIKSEFMSDLYKLNIKWSKRGQIEYAKSINLIIEAYNLPPEEKEMFETAYGREYAEKLIKAHNEQ